MVTKSGGNKIDEKMGLNPNTPITTFNANGLNTPLKTQILLKWGK